MYKVRICFEIANAAVDENNQPAPAGMQITLGEADHPVDYGVLTENVNVPVLIKSCHMEDVFNAEDIRLITPEEYDEKYGDEEDEPNS